MNLQLGWRHQFTPRAFVNFGYQFSRFSSTNSRFLRITKISRAWRGSPATIRSRSIGGRRRLSFAGGITGLNDSQYSAIHNQTDGVSFDALWNRGRHNITYGTDFRRQQFNSLSQQDPRGSFAFNGLAAGSDFAGFLLGVPDTASIAFGNADKYFRSSSYDAFVQDDWRMRSSFTLNVGLRWEYNSPISELYGRLVNLDVAPGFTAVAPVLGSSPTGPLTQQSYPGSLIHPDKNNIAPRIAMSWRPFPASSMVVRASYGVYFDTSIYQAIASQMAQQSPLSKSLRVQNSAATPLTLANGFIGDPNITANTFAVDPNFRTGYIQTWQVSIQRDLPFALQLVTTYLGTKGTRSQQQFLSEYVRPGSPRSLSGVPVGIHLPGLQRQFDPARRDAPAAPPLAERTHRGASVHLLEIDRRCRIGRPRSGRIARRPGLAEPERGTGALEFRPAARPVAHGAVHHRHGIARRIALERMERRC